MTARVGALVSLVLYSAAAAAGPQAFPDSLKALSLEELMAIDVSTASRYPMRRSEIPADVHVITQDEIRRSGARSIAEALRLAPGVEVAREGSYSWNVSMRGFNGDLSNKLLVLVDGRSVYSPLFAGVFWDVQDYLLEDIDRIEVVGGPGGTLWSTNAVNGVINIITRPASAQPGILAQAGTGDEEEIFGSLRAAGAIGRGWHGRAYAKYFERDPALPLSGEPGIDEWDMRRAGFRLDRDEGEESFTVQGDAYAATEVSRFNRDFTLGTLPDNPVIADIDLGGGNLLARWSRRPAADAETTVQLYFDRTQRDIPQTFDEDRNTWNLDFQQRSPLGERHDFIWGAGARYTEDSIGNSAFAQFLPPERNDWILSAFAQDRIALRQDRLYLTAGSKLEHNDYSGWEVQPNLALTALVSDRHTLWASTSRAVRIPARLDHNLFLTAPFSVPGIPLPIFVQVSGTEDFDSEKLWAFDVGWRAEWGTLALDLSAYHHEYEDLQTQEALGPPVVVPGPPSYILIAAGLRNGKDASGNGATLAATWQPNGRWRVQLNYTYFDLDVSLHPGSDQNPGAFSVEGDSPKHQAAVYSYLDLPHEISLFAGLRYVDELPSQGVADYFAFDANLIWRASEHLELALAGRNLFDPGHLEFSSDVPREIERSWHLRATWSF